MCDNTYKPFVRGTQYYSWMDINCDKCVNGRVLENMEFTCDIDRALDDAFWTLGTVSEGIALRMGFVDEEGVRRNCHVWPCKERKLQEG